MKKISMLSMLLLFALVTFYSPAFSVAAVADPTDVTAAAAAINASMQLGQSPDQAVAAAIQAGFSVSAVFDAALNRLSISLDSAIKGAISAGVTTDVISRSATAAGANPQQVAQAMGRAGTGLAYTPAGGAGGSTPPVNPSFGSTTNTPNQGSRVISPSVP